MSRVAEILADMSTWGDADSIASWLGSMGVRGCRTSANACPVTQYFREAHGLDVTTVPRDLLFSGKGFVREFFPDHRESVTHSLPANVSDFAVRFDDGAYPQLELSNGNR